MGIYVNPKDQTKEGFLLEYGVQVNEVNWDMIEYSEPAVLPVVLVDNGPFTAAGVAYNERELADFKVPDGRPKKYYLVLLEDLIPVTDGLDEV